MMKNKRLEERRKKISNDVDISVKQSFEIVDRIHEILVKQGKDQKDLAILLGKSESEISKWMTGTHNFTINTLSKIQAVLGEPIIQTTKENSTDNVHAISINYFVYEINASTINTIVPNQFPMVKIQKSNQSVGSC